MTCALPADAGGLDHVGVEGALGEPVHVAVPARLLLEDLDEEAADDLALALGIGDARQRAEEPASRVDP